MRNRCDTQGLMVWVKVGSVVRFGRHSNPPPPPSRTSPHWGMGASRWRSRTETRTKRLPPDISWRAVPRAKSRSIGMCYVEFLHQLPIEHVSRRHPAALFGYITLPVHQILHLSPPSPGIQKLLHSECVRAHNFHRRWMGGCGHSLIQWSVD